VLGQGREEEVGAVGPEGGGGEVEGGELVGEVAQYEDIYRLCYIRGPAGIIVALAEELRR
jgi:hypothetical protein